ncbi:glycosylphosphatidylinositol anchor biosynthesis [Verticillium nonalfalfae]|uniref:Mannosyltransferase n=1 Tax=Verticillium nonalfalfae TaxID=1051616 RepID=A0A3M9YIP6_9PEZI|nr:glycosylphosphatidylinositol anchor biosynthesis [Verticillium nonalfalfae]RNJ58960.1 glycosylphosphatidylinositol anchor biosynthesis [Verticillium nonalfalfae]
MASVSSRRTPSHKERQTQRRQEKQEKQKQEQAQAGHAASDPDSDSDPQLLMEARNEQNRTAVLLRLLVIRAFNAYWVTTFFQPDEYFQALEPAWQMAFGPGAGAWLTWEWQHQLRSSLHPALFAAVYWLADQGARLLPVWLDARPILLAAAPKAAQAAFAAAGDWCTWQLAVRLFGPDTSASWFALFMSMCNPFHWYCSTRTFSNSLETTLTVAALNYWPWELFAEHESVKENPKGPSTILKSVNGLRLSLVLAAIAVTLRPTNIIIWLTVIITTFATTLFNPKSVVTSSIYAVLIREIILCGALVLGLSLVSDRLWFGEWTLPAYKWLYFNISQSLAVFYGRNDWHYYLSQGIPLLTTTFLPFALVALYKTPSTGIRVTDLTLRTLAASVYAMIATLSLISHKEVRFIYPLLPMLHVLAAPLVSSFFTNPAPAPTREKPLPRPTLARRPLVYIALLLNATLAGYLSIFHQPAPLQVLDLLRADFERVHPGPASLLPPFPEVLPVEAEADPLYALFLTPCHSTPWRVHLVHPALRARALTCEPPLHTAPDSPERLSYRDEADRFYDDPIGFLGRELWPTEGEASPVPRYIIGFEGIEPWITEFFAANQHLDVHPRRVWSAWNGLFSEDWRRAGRLVVWQTRPVKRAPPPVKET